MSYEGIRKSIQGFFNTNFTAVTSDKIAWDNVEFNQPTDESEWIRVSVQNNTSNFNSFGPNRLTRRMGIVFVQVFVPKNSTTLVSDQIIDDAINVFETKQLAGVVFESPDVREAGISEDGWFQTNISVPFYSDDITSIS